MVHLAGFHLIIGPRLRQRCAWCGATLIDKDLDADELAVDEAGNLNAAEKSSDWWMRAHGVAPPGMFVQWRSVKRRWVPIAAPADTPPGSCVELPFEVSG